MRERDKILISNKYDHKSFLFPKLYTTTHNTRVQKEKLNISQPNHGSRLFFHHHTATYLKSINQTPFSLLLHLSFLQLQHQEPGRPRSLSRSPHYSSEASIFLQLHFRAWSAGARRDCGRLGPRFRPQAAAGGGPEYWQDC